jgi:hypothetical protein
MIPIGRPTLAFLVLAACDTGGPSASTPPPVILRVTWDSGSQDLSVADGPVAVWAPLDVWFDRFLDPDSVTASAVRVESNAQVVRAAATYDVLDRRVRVTPARDLDPSLAYEVVVTQDVRSLEGTPVAQARHELSTGPFAGDEPPERASVGWGEAGVLVASSCESSTCHGDDETAATCGTAAPFRVAMGLELDAPEAILETAIDVPARQWPRFMRIEPGRPDRSYVTYKLVDFGEEIVIGNVMPTLSERGGGTEANGSTSPGACCAVEELPVLHPPPWAEHAGRHDPDALRRRSLAYRTPSVWACACADTRGRFPEPPGACRVAEGDCGDDDVVDPGDVDDDRDGLTDCEDPDCHFASNCPHERSCDDGRDEDGDEGAAGGGTDCTDPDCFGAELCAEVAEDAVETECDDGTDDDGDGAADCSDFDCVFSLPCFAGLEVPDPAPVAYCRGRVASDWILAGAPLGPDGGLCERACAADCDGAATTYDECKNACLASGFDEASSSCVRESFCTAFGGPSPRPDGEGRVVLSAGGLSATCAGAGVVRCVAEGAGEVDPATEACVDLCVPIGDLCTPLAACAFGGS